MADAQRLTVVAGAVDASGLDPYTASVNRAGLAVGRHSGSIRFALAGGGAVSIPVSMQVGDAPSVGDMGYAYVLLLDPTLKTVGQARGRSSGGTLAYELSGVPPGEYFIVAGT